MKTKSISSKRHRFPAEIISHAVWRNHRFFLSFREVALDENHVSENVRSWPSQDRFWCKQKTHKQVDAVDIRKWALISSSSVKSSQIPDRLRESY